MSSTDFTKLLQNEFGRYKVQKLKKGHILLYPGERASELYYLKQGKIRVYDIAPNGDEFITNIYKSGTLLPIALALNPEENRYFYKTESECEVYFVPISHARQFLGDNPTYVLDVLSRVYRGIEGVMGRLLQLMGGSARSRLIYELLIECERFGQLQTDGSYLLSTNEKDMASRTGLSRETVSREIGSLKGLGLVTIKGRAIQIIDKTELDVLLKNTT